MLGTKDGKVKVLLIEDNPDHAHLIGEILAEIEDMQFDLVLADRFAKSQEHLTKRDIDIILLDLSLPDSQGVDTFTKINAQAPEVPVIVVSSLKDEKLATDIVKAGAQDYLVKGQFDGNLLKRSICYAIERKQAEEALQDSEEKWRSITENSPDIIMTWDLDGKILFINRTVPGLKKEEVIGTSCFNYTPKEFWPVMRKSFERVLKTCEPDKFECEYLNSDGDTQYFESRVGPVIRNGQVVAVTVSARDITERKRAEETIRGVNETYLCLLKNAQAGFFRTRISDGKALEANDRLVEIFGYESREQFLEEYYAPEHYVDPHARQKLLSEIKRKGFVDHFLAEGIRKDGSTFWARFSAYAHPDKNYIDNVLLDISLERQSIDALKKSEASLAKAQEIARLGFWEWDAITDELYWSDEAYRSFGFRPQEFVPTYDKFISLLHPDDVEFVQRHIEASLHSGAEYDIDFRIVLPSGEVRYLHVLAEIVRDEKGSAVRFVGIQQDITERKQTEEALLVEKEKIEKITQNIGAGLCVISKDYRTLWANKVLKNIFGNVERGKCHYIYNKRNDICSGCGVQEVFETGKDKVVHEQLGKDVDGNKIWSEIIATPIRDKDGNITSALELVVPITERKLVEIELDKHRRDLETLVRERTVELEDANKQLKQEITERKLAEEALHKSEERYRCFVDNVDLMITQMDTEYNVVMANVALSKKLKKSLKKIIGKKCFREFEKRDGVCPHCPGKRAMATRITQEVEAGGVLDDGTKLSFWIRSFPTFGPDGAVTGFLEIAEDLTEHKRTEIKIKGYQEKLRSLASELSLTEERERRRIAIDLHDHVGQNLAISKIKLCMLKELAPSGDFVRNLDEVKELIEETINYTRTLTFELAPPMLYELGLEPALEWLTEQINKRHGIKISFKNDNSPKPIDDEVRVLLFQAVRELFANIIKHAQAHNANVSVRRDIHNIRINVMDDGIGFDTSQISSYETNNHAFGIFSIRERLDYFGGRIEIESKPGHGTRVSMVAPLKNTKRNKSKDKETNYVI